MDISRPHDLEKGDKISFHTKGLAGIDGEVLTVDTVSTYVFDGEVNYAEFTLVDNYRAKYFLSIELEDGEEYLTLSKEIRLDEIHVLFGQDTFDEAVKSRGSAKLKLKDRPSNVKGWVAKRYKKDESFEKAKFSRDDFRKGTPSSWDEFDYHLFLDSSEEMAIEVEDYGDREIEVSLTIYPDFEDIKSMTR